jgi:fatty acid desaturase
MQAPAEETTTDLFADTIPVRIPSDTLRRLSVLNPYITSSHILLEWILILSSITLCWRWWGPAAYVACVIWIGGRQHALAILMHDGAHFRIFRNKLLNDWVSDLFLAWPILITTARYRSNHWEHHKYTNTEKDPDCLRKLFQMKRSDWEFPTTRSLLFQMLLKDLTAISTFTMIKTLFSVSVKNSGLKESHSLVPGWARIVFYISIICTAVVFGFWKALLLFWFVPYLTTFNLFLHIRSIAEHFATENDNPLNITRTTITPWWEKLFFPKNMNYHLEHHLYPSVPFYRLPELHRLLLEQEVFRKQAHITRGYFGVLSECVSTRGEKRSCLPITAKANIS